MVTWSETSAEDRTKESVKHKGGGVYIKTNKRWFTDVQTGSSGCSPDLEHHEIDNRPFFFYLPRVFTALFSTTVYNTIIQYRYHN